MSTGARWCSGDAADEGAAGAAADAAEAVAPLGGWVNNAAVFRDAWLHDVPAREVLAIVEANLAPAVVGYGVAVQRFLRAETGGSVVNVSGHQAQRAGQGALPYATAKAALEGLTRAVAVDYGRHGIRVSAVALGSVRTERSDSYLEGLDEAGRRSVDEHMARVHPLGRMGGVGEVAAAVGWLLSDAAGFVTGTVEPVDGGRAARGEDPEEA